MQDHGEVGGGVHRPVLSTASVGVAASMTPGTGQPAASNRRHPPSCTTGARPPRIARATSDSVPHEPPTTITASADLTIMLLRASPIPVGMTIDRSALAPVRSGPDRMPTTVPPAERAPAATAAITPP